MGFFINLRALVYIEFSCGRLSGFIHFCWVGSERVCRSSFSIFATFRYSFIVAISSLLEGALGEAVIVLLRCHIFLLNSFTSSVVTMYDLELSCLVTFAGFQIFSLLSIGSILRVSKIFNPCSSLLPLLLSPILFFVCFPEVLDNLEHILVSKVGILRVEVFLSSFPWVSELDCIYLLFQVYFEGLTRQCIDILKLHFFIILLVILTAAAAASYMLDAPICTKSFKFLRL